MTANGQRTSKLKSGFRDNGRRSLSLTALSRRPLKPTTIRQPKGGTHRPACLLARAGGIAVDAWLIPTLSWALPVELFSRCEDLAHMSARPRTERFHGLPQGAAELGQFVIHTLRSGGEDSPRDEAVSL
jgi:hypothetical protein